MCGCRAGYKICVRCGKDFYDLSNFLKRAEVSPCKTGQKCLP